MSRKCDINVKNVLIPDILHEYDLLRFFLNMLTTGCKNWNAVLKQMFYGMKKLVKNIKGHKPKTLKNEICSGAFYGFQETTAGENKVKNNLMVVESDG